jgi:hypothetical protein
MRAFPGVEILAHPARHEQSLHRAFAAQDLDLDIPGLGCGVAGAHGGESRFSRGLLEMQSDLGFGSGEQVHKDTGCHAISFSFGEELASSKE